MMCRNVHDEICLTYFYPNMDMIVVTEINLIWCKFCIPYPIKPWDMQ